MILEYVLQKTQFAENVERSGTSSRHVGKKISSVKEAPEQSDRSFFLGIVQAQKTEPIIPSTFLELSWLKVGTDLFDWQKFVYLIIMDYYSRFIEIAQLDRTTAETVIQHCKNIFSRYGIPKEVVTNNGSQFDSNAFRNFLKEYQFRHVTSSPYYLRSIGKAE